MVELDGGVHGQPSPARSDARRDAHLPRYTVLRLPNGLVRQAPELFAQRVLRGRYRARWIERVWFGPPHPSRPG